MLAEVTSSVARVRQVELSAISTTAAPLAAHRPPTFDMLMVPR
jgi:hypothetical protein